MDDRNNGGTGRAGLLRAAVSTDQKFYSAKNEGQGFKNAAVTLNKLGAPPCHHWRLQGGWQPHAAQLGD